MLENKFEALDVQGMIKLLNYAMRSLGEDAAYLQDMIIKQEKFGKDALSSGGSFNPLREMKTPDYKSKYESLMRFAEQTQRMLDHVKEIDSAKWAKEMKEYFNSQKFKDDISGKGRKKKDETGG